MAKITGPKGALLAGALAAGLSGCGGGNGSSSPEQSINQAPEITGVPSSISMTELTKKEVDNIICQDPNGDNTTMSILSSDSNLKVNYNSQTNKLELDASSWNLADGVNKNVGVTLTCSDGDLNTTKNIEVIVQDEANDKYMTYTTNIPNSVEVNTILNGSISLNDPDGNLEPSYNFDLLDENNNSVYSGVIEDVNNDGNYSFSIDFSNLPLPAGNYRIKTEEIYPVDGGENYQGPVVIEQDIILNELSDTQKPTITLNGPSTITLTVGEEYIEQGATANDNVDGDLTNEIIIDNSNVNTSVAGTYTVTYTVVDSAGNETTITRTVEVLEPASWNVVDLQSHLNNLVDSNNNIDDKINDTDEETIAENLRNYIKNIPEGGTFTINPISGTRVQYIKISGNRLYYEPGDTGDDDSQPNKFTITYTDTNGNSITTDELSLYVNNN